MLRSIDPILYGAAPYGEACSRISRARAAYFADTLAKARVAWSGAAGFCEAAHRSIEALSDGTDIARGPYRSSVLNAWIDRVNSALKWIELGADPAVLQYSTDANRFQIDLEHEFGPGFEAARTISSAPRWVDAAVLAQSPVLSQRLADCLPGCPGPAYRPPEPQLDRQVRRHVDAAIERLSQFDAQAAADLRVNAHTIYGAVIRGVKNSMGTRFDLPGTVMVGLSEERLADDDLAFTASQLYHEHAHLKLSLYFDTLAWSVPSQIEFISPFKNDMRELGTMLHTTYTLSLECLLRLRMVQRESDSVRLKALAYLAAVGIRLQLCAQITGAGLALDAPQPLRAIVQLAALATDAIQAAISELPSAIRRAHDEEAARVRARHAWDVGQFLLRGLRVCDPALSRVSIRDGTVEYWMNSTRHQARIEPARPSVGDYGRYAIEASCA